MDKTERKLMHYMRRAISDYAMIQDGDRILVCLSGGKDSFTMLHLLHQFHRRSRINFELFAFTLDQNQPGWDDDAMRAWLDKHNYPYAIVKKDTYSVVLDKVKEGKTYCSLCSRLRRGNIYGYAERNGFNKIALGHHRDDLIESMLMSILYNGIVRSMPPKLLNDEKKHIVIRPLAYCQEADIKAYSDAQQFPIIPCNLCGSQENLTRQRVKQLIADLAAQNPKVPSNIHGAIGNIQPSQLMDSNLWDFRNLEDELISLPGVTPKSKIG